MLNASKTLDFRPAQSLPIFVELAKLRAGDKVAVISSSAQLAGVFTNVYELGLDRIRDSFELLPVELPTTRATGSSLQERARDIMAAFANPATNQILLRF